ncbi:MAG: hypothetical protein Q7S58_00995 [Candidatus Binatus sp.]|uniref:hypothetical protein n=1 Tax=Candidatus Binatus sp. TaxID=2811406 RepID=UPI00271EA8CA|nr:hypothetical protein [Candidatus Binatus sp.]MDO8430964.1 hypothetical protein [Candidatus Binatus sp.]
MAADKKTDPAESAGPAEARPPRPAESPATQPLDPSEASPSPEPEPAPASKSSKRTDAEGRLEVRPIGTAQGFRELAALHKRTWSMLNVREKKVHALMWPLAIHFGLYSVKPGNERKRPPLIGAFWARCLADAPLTLGHLYPASLFNGDMLASEVFEFGGMVIDPTYQGRGLVKMMSDTARLFLFSRRPKLIITNPVEPLYEMYKQLGLKTVGRAPVDHPLAYNVKVWLMYGKFDELAKPYFM